MHTKQNNGVTPKCEQSSVQRMEYCSCGWSYLVPRAAHVPNTGVWVYRGNTYTGTHGEVCKVCGNFTSSEYCSSSAGLQGACGKIYTCVKCKYNHTVSHPYAALNKSTGKFECSGCQIAWGTGSIELVSAKDFEIKYRFRGTITQAGATRDINHMGISAMGYQGTGLLTYNYNVHSSTPISWDYTATVVTDKANTEALSLAAWMPVKFSWGTQNLNSYVVSYGYPMSNDVTAPTYISHSTDPVISGNNWAIQRNITVTFMDSTTNYVDIGLTNASGIFLVPYGRAMQSGNNWTRTFRLMIDAPAAGAQFIVKAKDRSGNETSKTISLSHTDALAPVSSGISGNSTAWTKSKTIRLSATETGSGAVEMALGKESDYCLAMQTGTTYYRDFTFTGTTTAPVTKVFLIRDSMGNTNTYSYDIGYLDNAIPTMTIGQSPDTTGVTWHKGDCVLTVTLEDVHSGLGDLTVPAGCSPTGVQNLGGVKNATKTFIVREPGVYTFRITDVAGNETVKTINISNLDNIDPDLETEQPTAA